MQCGHAICLRRVHIGVLFEKFAERGMVLLFDGVSERRRTGERGPCCDEQCQSETENTEFPVTNIEDRTSNEHSTSAVFAYAVLEIQCSTFLRFRSPAVPTVHRVC